MKLNVGSSAAAPLAGWVHYDATAWPVSVRGDARALPFRDAAFEVVHCAHLVEHIPLGDVPAFLIEIRRVMRRDAILYLAAPDGDRTRAVRSMYWQYLTRRGGVVPGWQHQWICTVAKLWRLCERAGLIPTWTSAVPQGHPPNLHAWPVDLETRFLCRRDDFGWPHAYPAPYQVIWAI